MKVLLILFAGSLIAADTAPMASKIFDRQLTSTEEEDLNPDGGPAKKDAQHISPSYSQAAWARAGVFNV